MNYAQTTAALFSTLSASEKGYLKKFFKTRIAVLAPKKAEQFNELFIAVEAEPGSLPGAFSEETQKGVLDLLLFGLEEYHKNNASQARSYISQVEILLEKNLNSQAEKLLAKAKKLARKEENYEMLYEIIEWQVAIHSLKPPTEKNIKIFDEYFDELNEIVERQTQIAEEVY
jgi:hypothetical protein